jgi:hypothetical protein
VRRGVRFVILLLAALMVAAGGTPSFADPGFGYTPVAPPPAGEKNHAQILKDIYGQFFTPDGLNYVGDDGITAIRVYDFDDILYNTTHVYHHNPNDVDQIWTDGEVTVTALAKYASYDQAFGWNNDGLGTNFTLLVDDSNIGGPGVSFTITEGQEFLWGYQARRTGCTGWWWEPGLEWWSLVDENDGEDHMVTYFMEGVSPDQTVWAIFMEDLRFGDCTPSDRDYNDFVVEIRAIPEPATICLLVLGGLLLRRRKQT